MLGSAWSDASFLNEDLPQIKAHIDSATGHASRLVAVEAYAFPSGLPTLDTMAWEGRTTNYTGIDSLGEKSLEFKPPRDRCTAGY